MPRYVDAEPIEKFITDGLNNKEKSYGWVGVEILTEVHYTPTVDATPVVHAHWVRTRLCNECSRCRGGWIGLPETKFCPDCGAKMDEEEKEK